MLESQSVGQWVMFLRFCQILGISSGYVQGKFSVCSEYVQGMFRTCSVEHKTCDILAAERLRLKRFDNRLIIDSSKVVCCSRVRKGEISIV